MNILKNKNKAICQVLQMFQILIKRNLIFKEREIKMYFKFNLRHLN
jgi:hypothetical protein